METYTFFAEIERIDYDSHSTSYIFEYELNKDQLIEVWGKALDQHQFNLEEGFSRSSIDNITILKDGKQAVYLSWFEEDNDRKVLFCSKEAQKYADLQKERRLKEKQRQQAAAKEGLVKLQEERELAELKRLLEKYPANKEKTNVQQDNNR